jgi:hypothetical protein
VGTVCISFFCSGGNDEFADFSSAFSEGVTLSSNTVGSGSQQFSSGTIGSTTSVPSSNGNLGKNYYLYCSVVVVVLVVCKYPTSLFNGLAEYVPFLSIQ